ncbi:glycosyltransferase [Synechococcus sp. NOUM97013]|uniref:glycosyltransferase n=1 Tax=Synechococcus sp. NOUM97013 TaxID=1442555 RepID=UPI001647690A|nr:glycosyltransferase [Synechococcus sp. NOUM97013]
MFDLSSYSKGQSAGFNSFIEALIPALDKFSSIECDIKFTFIVQKSQSQFIKLLAPTSQVSHFAGSPKIIGPLIRNIFLPFISCFYDLLICPRQYAPLFALSKTFLIVHDLQSQPVESCPSNIYRLLKKLRLLLSCHCSDVISTISQFTATELKSHNVMPKYIIPNPYSPNLLLSSDTLDEYLPSDVSKDNYFITPSSLADHKNISNALSAFHSFCESSPSLSYQYILIGNWSIESFYNLFPLYIDCPRIVPLGYVDEMTKAALFKFSSAFLLPSIYEGFGIPYLEALSLSKPLICSDIPVCREICINHPFYISSPFDSVSIYYALMSCLLCIKEYSYSYDVSSFSPESIALRYLTAFKAIMLPK